MLVGFCILNKDKKTDFGRFFPEGVKVVTKEIGNSTIHLYGYGLEYEASIEEKTYSLYHDGLDHRNIDVTIAFDHVEIRSDWLGSFPCYYDEVSKEVASHWGMLDLRSRECDPIGSYTLKKYSFVPTSRTLKYGVRRMLSNEMLVWRPNYVACSRKALGLNYDASLQTKDVVERVAARLKTDGVDESGVIIPLSGGYDSRFLASIIKEKFGSAFKSFTYSLLGSDGDCFESEVSKVVAKKLGSPWRSFDLTGYARYENTIIDWSGGFSHVNGDYYEMFAEQVQKDLEKSEYQKALVVSGIVGDLWCGKVNGGRYLNAGSVLYSHGISTYGWMIDAREWKVSEQAEEELDKFFKNRITSNETFLLELVRAKIALLSFLCYSFERRGIRCSAPFLDKHVVEAVLSLDPKLRLNRKWQNEYFTNLGISDAHLPRTLLKINRLAVKEGTKKQFNSYEQLKLPTPKLLLLKILLSKPFRKAELALTQHKVTEYALRKLRYRRSDVLISILNVLTK
jgi:hypothetical protein